MSIETAWRDYDVIVVGSGGAGSAAAQAASERGARVLVVSKDPIGCSDTKISEGKVTVRGPAVLLRVAITSKVALAYTCSPVSSQVERTLVIAAVTSSASSVRASAGENSVISPV